MAAAGMPSDGASYCSLTLSKADVLVFLHNRWQWAVGMGHGQWGMGLGDGRWETGDGRYGALPLMAGDRLDMGRPVESLPPASCCLLLFAFPLV